MAAFLAFVVAHRWWVLLASALVTLTSMLALPNLRFNTDYLELIPVESAPGGQVIDGRSDGGRIDTSERAEPSPYSSSYFFVVESDALFDPSVLTAVSTSMLELERRGEFGPRLSPFVMRTVERQRVRALPVPMSPKSDDAPWTQDEAEVFRRRLLADDIARNYFVSSDGRAILIYYQVRPEGVALAEYSRILDPLRPTARVYQSGTAIIENGILRSLRKDAIRLSGLVLGAMLLASWIAFRSLRLMALPLLVSSIGTLWTLGAMSLLGASVTILTVIAPPLVLTLGSSYTIHILTRFDRLPKGPAPQRSHSAVASTVPTIALAALTTAIGFMSLVSANTPALHELALTVSFGIASCVVLSLTLIPALLATVPPGSRSREMNTATQSQRFSWNRSVRHWKGSIIAFALLVIAFVLVLLAGELQVDANYMNYFPVGDPLVTDAQEIARLFGGLDPFRITLTAPEDDPGFFRTQANLQAIHAYEEAILEASEDLVHVFSVPSILGFMNRVESGTRQIPDSPAALAVYFRYLEALRETPFRGQLAQISTPDYRSLTLVMRYRDAVTNSFQSVAAAHRVLEVIEQNADLLPAGAEYRVWGAGHETIRFDEVMRADQARATALSLVLVMLIASFAFRSVRLGLFSLVPTAAGVMAHTVFMSLVGVSPDLVTIAITSIIVGIGVDDAMHFLVRYRANERNSQGAPVADLVRTTLVETGRPIALTSAFLVAGLVMLSAASFTPVRYFGLLLSAALVVTMTATLFLLPGIMVGHDRLLGRFRRSRDTAGWLR